MSRADRLRALVPAVLALYWAAQTHEQERRAYQLLRALGMPPAYGEER
jgi:hypothetical protein